MKETERLLKTLEEYLAENRSVRSQVEKRMNEIEQVLKELGDEHGS